MDTYQALTEALETLKKSQQQLSDTLQEIRRYISNEPAKPENEDRETPQQPRRTPIQQQRFDLVKYANALLNSPLPEPTTPPDTDTPPNDAYQ